MPSTTSDLHCLHCGASVPTHDLAEGWCNSCGKRLPSSFQDAVRAGTSATVSPALGDRETEGFNVQRVLAGGTIVVLVGLLLSVVLLNVI